MAAKRTSKSIAERIDIDYYKRPYPLRTVNRWLSWGLLAAATAYVIAVMGFSNHAIFQAAPVSNSHQSFGAQCAQCHRESWRPLERLVTLNERTTSVPDSACRACHDTADHSTRQVAAQTPACVGCHREHRPERPLTAVADERCTICHANLQTSEGSPRIHPALADFEGHPEFGVFRTGAVDSTNLAFNHKVHLAPEGVFGPDRKREVLECWQCHQPDASRRTMQPIDYERHCARCHSNLLVFDPGRLADRPVPHGAVEPALAIVRRAYREYAEVQPKEVLGPAAEPVRFDPANPPASRQTDEALLRWIDQRVREAELRLLEGTGGCRYCHQVAQSEVADYQIPSARPPDRWYKMSVFAHNSHRMLRCVACHPAAQSTRTSDVLMPRIEVCRQCHGPQAPGRPAASNCVVCHDYHDHAADPDYDGLLGLGE